VKTADQLVGLYFTSVGRNSKLLLNVPPTRDGLLHDTDVARLAEMRSKLDAMFKTDFAKGRRVSWRRTGDRSSVADVDLGRTSTVSIIDLREDITRGQIVAQYHVDVADNDGQWQTVARGTTIGYRKLDRVTPVAVRGVRVMIDDALETPKPLQVSLY
jgi:alpha-L-fucosidase